MVEKKQPEEVRKLEKISGGKYKLTVDVPDHEFHSEQKYTKDKLKEVYNNEIKPKYNQIMAAIPQLKKQIKDLDVEDTKELREFKANIDKIQKLNRKVELERQLENVEGQQKLLKKQKAELEVAIPELARNK